MSHQEMTHEEIRKHVKIYLGVFATLLVLTVLTVAVSYMHLPIHYAILVALAVATVKGSLVACYFMHLISERAMLYGILVLCGFFFLVLLLLPVVTVQTTVGLHW